MATLSEQLTLRIKSELTLEQQNIVEAKGRTVVIACPGSGKTKTVAYRLVKLLLEWPDPKSGIAVLSFTNNAIKEIEAQIESLGFEYPLQTPHFLGTIDSFLTQNLFRPFGHLVMGCYSGPQIVPKEQRSVLNQFIPAAAQNITLGKGKTPKTIYLTDVHYLPNGDLDFNGLFRDLPEWSYQNYPKDALRDAKRKCAAAGLATHSDVVYWSYKLLTSEVHQWIAETLRAKYGEWIVDEAQDTSEFHERIMNILWDNQNTTGILVVGDPDQAIFEWNKAKPDFLLRLKNKENWNSLPLTENWRSSQLICNATHPFRNPKIFTHPSPAKSLDAGVSVRPVLLVFPIGQCGKLPNALRTLWEAKVSASLPDKGLAVTSWTNEMVGRIRGRHSGEIPLIEIGRRIAQSAFLYRSHREGEAYRIFEGAVCQLLIKRPDLGQNYEWLPPELSYHQWCEWLSQILAQISSFEKQTTVNQFSENTKEVLMTFFGKFPQAHQIKLGTKIQVKPKVQGQQPLASFFDDVSQAGNITIQTVHKLKGSSFDGLMLVSSYNHENQASDAEDWLEPPNRITGLCSERRRIAYVAMTRPRKLVVVAIPRECRDELINHSDWRKGGFERIQLEEIPPTTS